MIEFVVRDQTRTTNTKRHRLCSLNHLLSHFLSLRFVEIVLLWIINFLEDLVLFHFGSLDRLCQAFKDVLLTLRALVDALILQILLRLVEFE